jgi:tetrahydromethanopterin S-methyltransferase subunit F
MMEVQRLVDCEAAYHFLNLPLISSPIHVVLKKNGKFQLIIDMQYLNSHLVVLKFKMEDLETLSKMLEPEDQMFTVDLQDESKEKDFLGLVVWTMGRVMFLVPKAKKIKVTKEIMRLIVRSNGLLSARKVARIAGLCISLSQAVGLMRLLMKNLFWDLKTKTS